MLYRVVKVLMRIALRLFYRNIVVRGVENIPAKGPAVILANHPSSLMDAVIIGLHAKRPVFFFTRGDVFINKAANYIFSRLHMIPVYTHEGAGMGRSSVGFNEAGYKKGEEILTKGGVLLFFPEGNSRPGHQLALLRKGVFRMAFQAVKKNDFRYDIPFIPAGINYEDPVASNKTVLVNFGKPFFLSEYRQAYNEHPRGTLRQLCRDGFAAMEKTVLHIEDSANFQLAKACLDLTRNQLSSRSCKQKRDADKVHLPTAPAYAATRFEQEKRVCDKLNSMDRTTRHQLETGINNYFDLLKKHGLEDSTLLPQFSFSTGKKMMLFLLAPLFALGYLLNILPVRTGKWIADTRVYRQDFYSWIFVTSSLVLYILWMLLLFAIVPGGGLAGAGIMLTAVATGLLALRYRNWRNDYIQYRRLKRLPPRLLPELRNTRNRLVAAL